MQNYTLENYHLIQATVDLSTHHMIYHTLFILKVDQVIL